MAIVRPFMALRPTEELASKIAALPYDVMNRKEAKEIVHGNEYSFLHVDRAEIDLDDSIDMYDSSVYNKAKENLDKMVDLKWYVQDNIPCLYI